MVGAVAVVISIALGRAVAAAVAAVVVIMTDKGLSARRRPTEGCMRSADTNTDMS